MFFLNCFLYLNRKNEVDEKVKVLDIYKLLKEKDNTKMYLFKGGAFYYLVDDDARYISDKFGFKLTKFGKTVKCGFPVESLERHTNLFANGVVMAPCIVEENKRISRVVTYLKQINLNETNPKDAYIHLCNLKELINE